MRIIKNTSLQGFSIPFNTPEGIKYKFLGPKASFDIPDNWGSSVSENLVRRRMVKITQVESVAAPVTPSPKVKKNKSR
jgi:hypothetical protein